MGISLHGDNLIVVCGIQVQVCQRIKGHLFFCDAIGFIVSHGDGFKFFYGFFVIRGEKIIFVFSAFVFKLDLFLGIKFLPI